MTGQITKSVDTDHAGEIGNPAAGSKEEAQRRADRIRLFELEMAELEKDGVLSLSDQQRQAVSAHHAETLKQLAGQFDIDTSQATRQMSMGMRS